MNNIQYAVKIVYTGNSSLRPGEWLATYLRITPGTGSVNNPVIWFCGDNDPTLFTDKKGAMFERNRFQKEFDEMARTVTTAKMEIFTRVVEFDTERYLMELNDQQILTLESEVTRRKLNYTMYKSVMNNPPRSNRFREDPNLRELFEDEFPL